MENAWKGVQKTDGSVLFSPPCLFFTFEIEALLGLQNFAVIGEIAMWCIATAK